MNIEERKRKIIEKYGTEPTISYYYFLRNIIDYAGEERVRQSFDSVKENDVIIGDYSSTDKTKEIAEEYGFKVVNVEKTKGISFHESKIVNKIIFESKSNFLVDLNIHVEYPKNIDKFCRIWLQNNDTTQKLLVLTFKLLTHDGRFKKIYGGSCLVYRPYLLAARGYDERTYYGFGNSQYAMSLLSDIYKLSLDEHFIGMYHKSHGHLKWKLMREMFPGFGNQKRRSEGEKVTQLLRNNLQKNFDVAVKKVLNSYW